MSIIVTDTGFLRGTDPAAWIAPEQRRDLAPDTDPRALPDLLQGMELVRISFPSFADGRGFTLARLVRQSGYRGHLRAQGHVIADQYTMARRSGFDDVEIDADLAARQPEAQWLARADWKSHDYQSRLRGRAA
ncbi:DUF934 domain-containing protein [Marivita sp. GX14005]|uniref:DUF934 domain-containing protein n=1 Tax=Marivita sp. GX14005 TaxID=2942276 RepID=UPI002019511C|nr:DUF934 domain-containing protein [Marivita sp. GX14005]MCL3882618.1 DUF934 domain-containing protein [Marivita sp. GX14005]